MGLSKQIAEKLKLSETEMAEYIISATSEVFCTMVTMEPVPDYPLKAPVNHFHNCVSGIVGFAGSYSGSLAVHCPLPLALSITGHMLGIESPEVGEELEDAIGEIANMLAGNVKQLCSKGGLDVKLSIPTIITGDDYVVSSLSNVDSLIVPFTVDRQVLLVGVTLQLE